MFKVCLATIFAWACITAGVSAAPLDDEDLPAPGTRIWVDGHRLHLHCSGQGTPTVVLDAGLGGTSLEWARVQPAVAKFTHVCSYDRAGYGWSDGVPGPRTSNSIVSELRGLLGFGSVAAPYVLVGHSFGGLATRLYAQRFPKQIAGIVLLDATHEAQFENSGNKALTPKQDHRFVIGNHWEIPAALPDELRGTARRLALTPDAVRTLYSELRHIRRSAEQVKNVGKALPDVPLVVIAHDSRRHANSERSKRFAERWMRLQRELSNRTPGGKLVVAADSGHHIHLEQPQLVIDAIRSVVQASTDLCGGAVERREC